MSLGQKGSVDPGAMLTSLLNKREKLRQELRSIEKQVYELETSYLQESSHIAVLFEIQGWIVHGTGKTEERKRTRSGKRCKEKQTIYRTRL